MEGWPVYNLFKYVYPYILYKYWQKLLLYAILLLVYIYCITGLYINFLSYTRVCLATQATAFNF